jgi:6-phosphogluconate dehydrogenase
MLTLASVVDGSQSMTKSHFGLIGLGVMGENLVLNAERNGFQALYTTARIPKPRIF